MSDSQPRKYHYDSAVRELYKVQDLAESTNTPKEVKDGIAEALRLVDARDQYTEDICSPDSDVLKQILEFTTQHDWQTVKDDGKSTWMLHPRMITGNVVGLFLKFLASMMQAKRVLEIGMYTGYGTLQMAEALPPDGTVITCDTEKYLYDINRKMFDQTPHGKKIDIKIGPAKETLLSLAKDGLSFDLIFIDADKEGNPVYYDTIMEKNLLAPRGTIVVDNAFRYGDVYTTKDCPVKAFNTKIRQDDRVQQVLLPVRDGLLAIRRKEEVNGKA